tara:strand:+ start:304 stop:903 length:600 start_codon:yes stop_codon:yes gene_type:complete
MPKRSQLNVVLNPLLIAKVKCAARREGLSISEYISNLISNETEEGKENEIESLSNRLSKVESHIDSLKSNCPGQSRDQNMLPFTQEEAENCTNFMRAVFRKIIEVRGLKSNKTGWDDFLPHLSKFDSWDLSLTNRLREILLFEEPESWTYNELNRLTKDKKCPCPIREALISWTKINKIPDQQTICDKGEKLVSTLLVQ